MTHTRLRRTGADVDEEPPYIEPVLPSLDQAIQLSSEVSQHNYSDLVRLYYRNSQARVAVKVFKDITSRKLRRRLPVILRDHRALSITDGDEIDWREGFDHLLTCYSVLELGLQAGYITGLSAALRRDALAILQDSSVRAFYEEHYPLLLPQLLRIRLVNGRAYQAHTGPRQLVALQRTIELDRGLLAHPDVVAFLTLADDFWVEGFNRSDLLQAVSDPASLIDYLTRRGRRRTYLDQAVHGLRQFLHLCEGLRHVLRSVEGDPGFQSGLWHLFGYWFADRREAIVPTIRALVKQMQKSAAALPKAVALETPRQAQELLDCVDDLASARYAKPLRNALRSLRRA